MAFSLSACEESYTIDIGGEASSLSGEPLLSCQTRIMLKKHTFSRNESVEIKVGFGLLPGSDPQYYISGGLPLVLEISAKNFLITNGAEAEDLYEKVFEDYDSKFVCTRIGSRYIPNYYETFRFKLSSGTENASGYLHMQAAILYTEDNRHGESKTIYYAANTKKIAFSAKSISDAQKKL